MIILQKFKYINTALSPSIKYLFIISILSKISDNVDSP